MFKKCLKYDVKSIVKIWWILAVSAFVMGVIGSFALRTMIEFSFAETNNAENNIVTILAPFFYSLLFMVSICVLVAFVTVTLILVYVRFYRNFYTDEGYLTFTLPVSRRTLYLSKTLNALIWLVASVLVVIAVVMVALLVVPTQVITGDVMSPGDMMSPGDIVQSDKGFFNPIAYQSIGLALSELWALIGGWLIVYAVEGLLFLLLAALFSIGLIQMCITIGSTLAKKHKILAAIGVYYGINTVLGGAMTILQVMLIGGIESGLIVMDTVSDTEAAGIIALFLLGICAAIAVADIVIHFFTLAQIERKLNLS